MKTQSSLANWLVSKSILMLALASVFSPAFAEDLTDTDKAMCAPARVNICTNDGTCISALPWEVNVPQFIVVDFKNKTLATTESSDRPRATPIKTMSREDGVIYLQGLENGRAFSFAINESTGFMTVAVARDYLTVTGSGACTPTN